MIETNKHPEFAKYQQTARQALPFVRAVADWRLVETPLQVERYGIEWTPARAEGFLREVSSLMVEYNRVVWEDFSFCRVCKGKCCIRGAPSIDATDFLALALFGEALPVLPATEATDERLCIYLRGHFCSWPDDWRTFGCWTFYCLGPPVVYESLANGRDLAAMYAELAGALEATIEERLPDELRIYQQVEGICLAKGVAGASGFAWDMLKAMERILVGPFCAKFSVSVKP